MPALLIRMCSRSPAFPVPGGEGVDRRRVEKVELSDLDALDPGQRKGGAVRIACADSDGRAGFAECAGGLKAEPDVAAGDDDVGARQVDAVQNLVGRRRRGEAGSKGMLLFRHGCPPTGEVRTLD